MTVDVFSQQYAWSFGYPGKEYAYSQGVLHVPVNKQIVFKMHSQDVIHSFWVPQWRIKKDNVPGITTTAIVTPTKTGQLPADLHRALRLRPLLDAGQSDRPVPVGLRQMGRRPQRKSAHRR